MTHYFDQIAQWFAVYQASTWSWFRELDRQEWVMLLMGVTLFGVMCMRGFGSRNNY